MDSTMVSKDNEAELQAVQEMESLRMTLSKVEEALSLARNSEKNLEERNSQLEKEVAEHEKYVKVDVMRHSQMLNWFFVGLLTHLNDLNDLWILDMNITITCKVNNFEATEWVDVFSLQELKRNYLMLERREEELNEELTSLKMDAEQRCLERHAMKYEVDDVKSNLSGLLKEEKEKNVKLGREVGCMLE